MSEGADDSNFRKSNGKNNLSTFENDKFIQLFIFRKFPGRIYEEFSSEASDVVYTCRQNR